MQHLFKISSSDHLDSVILFSDKYIKPKKNRNSLYLDKFQFSF